MAPESPTTEGEGAVVANLASRDLSPLILSPRESLAVEYKAWLDPSVDADKANIAQAIMALANYGGGFVVIGFNEAGPELKPAPPRARLAERFTADIVNGIVKSYADPPFHCEVYQVSNPATGLSHPVISVPGQHATPIRSRRDGPSGKHVANNTYYIRRPGPESAPILTAQEWLGLIERCVLARQEALTAAFRGILMGLAGTAVGELAGPGEQKSELSKWTAESEERWKELLDEKGASENGELSHSLGYWTIAFQIEGEFTSPSLAQLLDALRRAHGRETGWPPLWVPTGEEIKPHPYNGTLECWIADAHDTAHADFWRASPTGLTFLLRGYQEDTEVATAGKLFDVNLPIWRVGECVLHATRLAASLGAPDAEISAHIAWHGLRGRQLSVWADRGRRAPFRRAYRCLQHSVFTTFKFSASTAFDLLPEIVGQALAPLYEAFDLFRPTRDLLSGELARMRNGI